MTPKATRILLFLRENVRSGMETLREARNFVRRLNPDLTTEERLFLSCALRDDVQLEEFCAAAARRNGRRKAASSSRRALVG